MITNTYCKLCGTIKETFCCQSCYEKDATKSATKRMLSAEIATLKAQNEELITHLGRLVKTVEFARRFGQINVANIDSMISESNALLDNATG